MKLAKLTKFRNMLIFFFRNCIVWKAGTDFPNFQKLYFQKVLKIFFRNLGKADDMLFIFPDQKCLTPCLLKIKTWSNHIKFLLGHQNLKSAKNNTWRIFKKLLLGLYFTLWPTISSAKMHFCIFLYFLLKLGQSQHNII